MFDRFWSEYPRHVDKALARVKFAAITSVHGYMTDMRDRDNGRLVKIHLKATGLELVMGAAWYARECLEESTEPRYICHPATWLNRGRWMDYDADQVRAWFEERERRRPQVEDFMARRAGR